MATKSMAFGFSYGIAGIPELQQAMELLPKAAAGKALDNATRKAANVITEEIKLRAPVRADGFPKRVTDKSDKRRKPGYLKKRVGTQRIKVTQTSASYTAGMRFNLSTGKARGAFYAYYQEYGTKHMAAKPFIRPAYEAKKAEALQTLLSTLDENIVREASRLRKRVNIKYLTKGR